MPRTPNAYGYCRLSKDEITVRCSACHQEWTLRIKNKEQTEFDCPFCNRTYGSSETFCNTTAEIDAAHETWTLCHALEFSSR